MDTVEDFILDYTVILASANKPKSADFAIKPFAFCDVIHY